jgi:hypothetical protein
MHDPHPDSHLECQVYHQECHLDSQVLYPQECPQGTSSSRTGANAFSTRMELMDRAPPPGFRPPPGFPGAMPFPPGQMPPGYVPHFASDFILMIDSPLVRLSDCVVVWKVGVDGVDPVECSSIRFVLHSWHLCSIHLESSLVVACTQRHVHDLVGA